MSTPYTLNGLPRLPEQSQLTDENGFPTLELALYWDYFARSIETNFNNLAARITYSTTAPTTPNKWDYWVDNSSTPTVTHVYDGAAWQPAARYTTIVDQLSDGTYGKVLTARISSGKPWIDFSEGIHLNKNLDNIADGATYGSLPLSNISGSGTSKRALIDFTQAHTNKNLDNISDGTTYARPLAARLSVGKPFIDFSESINLNKNLDNVADGTTYGSLPLANIAGTGTSKRALIDFTQAHTNKSLANVDSTQNTKLNGIDTGATKNLNDRALNRNSAFEYGDLTGWSTYLGSPGTVSASANSTRGGNICTITCGNATRSEQLPCSPGETLYLAYSFASSVDRTGSVAPTWYMGMEFATSVGAAPGTFVDVTGVGGNTAHDVTAGVISGVFKITVPATYFAVDVRFSIDNGLSGTGSQGYVSYCEIHRDEPGSTIGADWGTNLTSRPSNLSALAGTEAIKNNLFTVNASGQVTYDGTNTINAAVLQNSKFSINTGGQITYDGTNTIDAAVVKNNLFSINTSGQITYDGTNTISTKLVDNNLLSLSTAGVLSGGAGGSITALDFANVAGATKPANNATVNTPRGVWVSGTSYVVNDMVSFSNALYICILATSGTTNPNSDTTHWAQYAPETQDDLADGTTYKRVLATALSANKPGCQVAGSGIQIGDQRNLPSINAANLHYTFTGAITYTSTSTTATISVAAGTLFLGTQQISYNAMSVGTTGSGTVTYYLYVNANQYTAGAHTLLSATTNTTIYNSDANVYIGTVTVSYGSSGSGTSGSGGCPHAEAYVHTNRGWIKAKNVRAGDKVLCLDADRKGANEWVEVESNEIKSGFCYKIYDEDGLNQVTVSESTPIVTREGKVITVKEIDGTYLPLEEFGEFRWARCSIEPKGYFPVAHIKCHQRTYSAGDMPEAGIFTHNPKP